MIADASAHIQRKIPRKMKAKVPEPQITATRRSLMSRIKDGNTAPEVLLRKALWAMGARYRLNTRIGRMRPDLVFKKAMLAIYVDGCFWHGCPEHYTPPRSRYQFWAEKLKSNVERDIRQTKALSEAGWRVLRIWEHNVVDSPVDMAKLVLAYLEDANLRPSTNHLQVLAAMPIDNVAHLELVDHADPDNSVHITRALITPKTPVRKSDSL